MVTLVFEYETVPIGYRHSIVALSMQREDVGRVGGIADLAAAHPLYGRRWQHARGADLLLDAIEMAVRKYINAWPAVRLLGMSIKRANSGALPAWRRVCGEACIAVL